MLQEGIWLDSELEDMQFGSLEGVHTENEGPVGDVLQSYFLPGCFLPLFYFQLHQIWKWDPAVSSLRLFC